jgi:hypothetical protein
MLAGYCSLRAGTGVGCLPRRRRYFFSKGSGDPPALSADFQPRAAPEDSPPLPALSRSIARHSLSALSAKRRPIERFACVIAKFKSLLVMILPSGTTSRERQVAALVLLRRYFFVRGGGCSCASRLPFGGAFPRAAASSCLWASTNSLRLRAIQHHHARSVSRAVVHPSSRSALADVSPGHQRARAGPPAKARSGFIPGPIARHSSGAVTRISWTWRSQLSSRRNVGPRALIQHDTNRG